jgi:hypothetical protein
VDGIGVARPVSLVTLDSATGGECRSAAPPGMFPANMDVRARVRHKFVWRAPGTRLPMVLHDFGYKGFHITRRLPSNGGVVMKQLVLDSRHALFGRG